MGVTASINSRTYSSRLNYLIVLLSTGRMLFTVSIVGVALEFQLCVLQYYSSSSPWVLFSIVFLAGFIVSLQVGFYGKTFKNEIFR